MLIVELELQLYLIPHGGYLLKCTANPYSSHQRPSPYTKNLIKIKKKMLLKTKNVLKLLVNLDSSKFVQSFG